jgi:hypothetical protein
MASLEAELATAKETIERKDGELAKAKRMMVALNNKLPPNPHTPGSCQTARPRLHWAL